MRRAVRGKWLTTTLALCLLGVGSVARADNPFLSQFHDGEWRLEFAGVCAIHSGEKNREGDFYFTGSVEYGWPIFSRAVLGLKAYPLFLYRENAGDRSETIFGVGAGVCTRIFARRDERTGLYGEAGIGPIWHSDCIQYNASRVNFLIELGIGYEFRNDWHIAVKWEHMSNGRLRGENSGVNGLGLAVGYRFRQSGRPGQE